MTTQSSQIHTNLIDLIIRIIEQDELLREKYQVGNRFIFVRNGLQTLLEELKNNTVTFSSESIVQESVTTHYSTVYVYLYNVQGLQLKSWLALLTPKALYEHSINRPIFLDQNEIEVILKSKKNPMQHAYIIVSVANENVIQSSDKEMTQTSLIRVKEGALHFNRLIGFVHNGEEYILDTRHQLVKKN